MEGDNACSPTLRSLSIVATATYADNLNALSPSPKPGVFRPGDSDRKAGRLALSRPSRSAGHPKGLALTARSQPGRYTLIQPGRWFLSPVLGFGNGRSR